MSGEIVLHPRRVQAFVQIRHQELVARDRSPNLADPLEVGRLAHQLVQAYHHGNQCADDVQLDLVVAQCSGMMVYAMTNYGLNFEAVVDVAEASVARVVAGLSPDIRRALGQRHCFHKGDMSKADHVTQLVKLAEIICATRHMLDRGVPQLGPHREADLRRWVDEQDDLLKVFQKVIACKRLKPTLEEAHSLLARASEALALIKTRSKVAAVAAVRAARDLVEA